MQNYASLNASTVCFIKSVTDVSSSVILYTHIHRHLHWWLLWWLWTLMRLRVHSIPLKISDFVLTFGRVMHLAHVTLHNYNHEITISAWLCNDTKSFAALLAFVWETCDYHRLDVSFAVSLHDVWKKNQINNTIHYIIHIWLKTGGKLGRTQCGTNGRWCIKTEIYWKQSQQ